MNTPAPEVGSVWGVPGKPSSYRLVTSVDDPDRYPVPRVFYQVFGVGRADSATNWEWKNWIALGAVDLTASLASEPAKPEGETVRVRACVGYDEEQKTYAVYGSGLDEETDAERNEYVIGWGYEPLCFIAADIPVRTFPTIEATVVEAKETDHAD